MTSATFDSIASEVNRRSLNIGAEPLLQWAGGRDHAPELLTEHVQQVAGVDGGVHLSGRERHVPRRSGHAGHVHLLHGQLPLDAGGAELPLPVAGETAKAR